MPRGTHGQTDALKAWGGWEGARSTHQSLVEADGTRHFHAADLVANLATAPAAARIAAAAAVDCVGSGGGGLFVLVLLLLLGSLRVKPLSIGPDKRDLYGCRKSELSDSDKKLTAMTELWNSMK